MSKLRTYLDGWLIAFAIPLVAAQVIVASGTYTFYSYMLPLPLAAAATIVMAVGIPLLEFAAVFERGNARYGYWSGMACLLFLELLAQYFKSQASFLPSIRRHISDPSGVDLATFAALPIGRVLPVGYIAVLSFVVVGLGYAVARRVRIVNAMAVKKAFDASEFAKLRDEFATLRERFAEEQRKFAEDLANAERRIGDRDAVIKTTRDELAGLRKQLAEIRANSAPAMPTRANLIDYVRGKLAAGVSLNAIAGDVGFRESTLRSMIAVPTNGHSDDEA